MPVKKQQVRIKYRKEGVSCMGIIHMKAIQKRERHVRSGSVDSDSSSD